VLPAIQNPANKRDLFKNINQIDSWYRRSFLNRLCPIDSNGCGVKRSLLIVLCILVPFTLLFFWEIQIENIHCIGMLWICSYSTKTLSSISKKMDSLMAFIQFTLNEMIARYFIRYFYFRHFLL